MSWLPLGALVLGFVCQTSWESKLNGAPRNAKALPPKNKPYSEIIKGQ